MTKYKSKGSHRIRFTRRNMLLVALVLVLALGGSVFTYTRLTDDESSTTTSDAGSQAGYVNLDPPTDQERQETEAHKNSLAEDQPTTPTSPSGKKQVTPIITSASNSEVNAYVYGVFEDGGICTATATKGSQVVTKSSSGFANVSYTSCAPISISLFSGTWSVVVSYSSAVAEGKSQVYKVSD